MMNFIDNLMNKVKNSEVLKSIANFISSFRKDGSKVNKFTSEHNEYTDTHKDHSYASADVGIRVARKIEKLLKKFGKKFKNTEKATSIISNIVNTIVKIFCVAATIAFGVLVVITIWKLLPTIISMLAVAFAVSIIIEVALSVISNGCGVSI